MQEIDADLLTLVVGDKVTVTLDDGDKLESVVRRSPWKLSHGQWVVGIKGIDGGYSLDRVARRFDVTCEMREHAEAVLLACRLCQGNCCYCDPAVGYMCPNCDHYTHAKRLAELVLGKSKAAE